MSKNIITIGRDPRCDIRVDARWDTVSNEHADIELRDGALLFYDHSSNGTLINGQRLHNGHVSVFPGDRILLAGTYELPWDSVRAFFPNVGRPTVNARAGLADQRPTVHKTNPLAGGEPATGPGRSRPTDRYVPPVSEPADTAAVPPKPVPPSGGGYSPAEVEAATRRWNWGAFFCSWIWAVCHRTYWPLFILLCGLVPYVGQVCDLVLRVHLGMNGSRIAWTCGKYRDFDHYRRAQRVWAIVGLVVFLLGLVVMGLSLYFILSLF